MSHLPGGLDLRLKELSLCSSSEHIPGASACLQIRRNKLVCVEYPAVIEDLQRALLSLGGERAVSRTYAHPNRRLELFFRPQDPFCHPVCGNRLDSGNLLLRVQRRVRKSDPSDVKIQMEILGVIGTTYKFQGMADFQCLAVHPENGTKTSLYNKIVLTRPETKEFFDQPTPLFLPPAIFSRLDTPIDYCYRPDVLQRAGSEAALPKNFVGLNRARRPHYAIFVSFLDPTPTECLEAAKDNWRRICLKECDRLHEQKVREMFERRPIWSRNAINANVNIHHDKLKLLLPALAYFMVTGPWRSLWVRVGYDPRESPESKQYQQLDFRIRCGTKHGYVARDMPVKAKRTSLSYALSITVNKTVPQPVSVSSLQDQEGSSQDPVASKQLKESAYIFREGMLPPYRQMFYQLCDIHVDRIQKVVNANQGLEKSCDERDGWCVVGTMDQIRDILSEMIKKVIRSKKSGQNQYKRRRLSLRARGPEKSETEDSEEDERAGEGPARGEGAEAGEGPAGGEGAGAGEGPVGGEGAGAGDGQDRGAGADKGEGLNDEACTGQDEVKEEEEDEDEFRLSEGSENEMETEILDYM